MFVPRTISVSKKPQKKESNKLASSKPKDLELRPGDNPSKNIETQDQRRSGLRTTKNEDQKPRAGNSQESADRQQHSSTKTESTEKCFDKLKSSSDDEEESEVVERSNDQRWPLDGEPVCAVCGKYGAYICDRTEKDVCSIECKMKNLKRDIKMRLEKYDDSSEIFPHKPNEAILRTEEVTIEEKQPPRLYDDSIEHNGSPDFLEIQFENNYSYKEHPNIQNLTEEQINFLKEKLEIRTQGENVACLCLEFWYFQFPSILAKNLEENAYFTPTPIQMQAIPLALSKRDLLACAETGTGKSASFLLPMITRISATTEQLPSSHWFCQHPLGVILGPTRELCMQIEEQAKMFSKGLRNMKTALIIGGNPLPNQLHRLKQGIQILIATPGRLIEIMEKYSTVCSLSFVQIFVLDEVDTMLRMGFQDQVDRILHHTAEKAQKMMFSATIPSSIEAIASKILQNPTFISVGPPSTPNRSVKQIILWVEEKSKKKRLFDLLLDKKHFIPPIVIFVDSKFGADLLADAINKVCGISCASLHGDKVQKNRTQILQDFQNGSYQALVSTSVLGRGIDLFNVLMVVNFDMPSSVNEYIHQVGRAGRLDKKGFAISFINNNNKDVFLNLLELFNGTDVKLPEELRNSPYLQQQKEKRERKGKKRKNEVVTTGNLMDLLKDYHIKKRT